jgi:hypothetical protein
VLLVVKVLDIGFLTTLDRPFNPVTDWAYTSSAIETMRDSFGQTGADLAVAGVVALLLAILLLTTLAVRRVTRVAARHRGWSLRVVTALGVVWALFAVLGTQVDSVAPVASRSAAGLALDQVQAVRTGVADHGVFAAAIARDRFRAAPADQLLTGLRGKDVIIAFVESYGKVALDDPRLAPKVGATLDAGTRRLEAAGFSSRSAWLTSSTYGGISWLAHSTLQAGVWVNSQRRYDQLMTTDRFTLSKAFKRAGWRTVDDVPSNNRTWVQGTSFYHYDKLYDRRNVGYQGRTFAYASMPDQFVMSAFNRLELAKPDRPPLFAEIDLVSSHEPWTRIPRLIPWDKVGDGSIYDTIPVKKVDRDALWSDPDRVRAAYGRSIRYTMNSLISFLRTYGDDDTVMLVLGDHQPWSVVSGHGASHDVPISVIAHDPKVLDQISGWSWQDGLRPDEQAPVWPMSAFRDRFLTAFGSQPATP